MSDAIDLSSVQIHNSPDVKGWPATAMMTRLEFRPTGVHVEHTRNQGPGSWPNFRPPGWDGDLQYTLWIFLKIGGTWHGSGCIQFWQACEENGGPPEEFAKNWYYAADRWAPMTGYQPRPGEPVGFMVSAGDARNAGLVSVQERSNVVLLPFPRSGDVYEAPHAPPGPPPPPPVDDSLGARVKLIEDTLGALINKVDALERKPDPVVPKQPSGWKGKGTGNGSLYGLRIPVSVEVVVNSAIYPPEGDR